MTDLTALVQQLRKLWGHDDCVCARCEDHEAACTEAADVIAAVAALCSQPSDAMVDATLLALESGVFREKDDRATMRGALKAANLAMLADIEKA